MASRCSTTFVDPPIAIATAIAFSKASWVRMSRGLIPCRSNSRAVCPARYAESSFRLSTAGIEASPGSDMPSASMAEAMVLAVNSPAHDPSPGHATLSSSFSSASVILPCEWAPTASKTSCTFTSRPWNLPARMVPPYTKTVGMFSRAAAITQPGRFLSHPATVTRASNHSAVATSSIESAITSRLTSDAFIPSVPMEMPSLTVIVPELEGGALGGSDSLLRSGRQPAQVHVARRHVARQVRHPHKRPSDSLIVHAHRAEVRTSRGPLPGPSVISLLRCFGSIPVLAVMATPRLET